MRIIVTGAAGLIGSAIVERLQRQHEVVGIDLRPAGPESFVADCEDVALWGPRIGAIDAIVHVAALHAPHVGHRPEAEFRRINVDATARLLDHAHRVGARHFVLTSTTSVYGEALISPGRAVWVDEALEPQPRDIYDVTKLEAEQLVASASLITTSLRMSRCFPEPSATMAGYRLHRGIDRRDVAEAHALALERNAGPSRTFIISAATPFRPSDSARLYDDASSVIEQRCPGLIMKMAARGWKPPASIDRVYDSGLAQRQLGFHPRYGIDACLEGNWDPAQSS